MTERINGNGRRINGAAPWVAIGLTFFINTALGFWFISDLSTRLGVAERVIESRASYPLRIGVLEERWRYISSTLDDIRRDLKTALQRRTQR